MQLRGVQVSAPHGSSSTGVGNWPLHAQRAGLTVVLPSDPDTLIHSVKDIYSVPAMCCAVVAPALWGSQFRKGRESVQNKVMEE